MCFSRARAGAVIALAASVSAATPVQAQDGARDPAVIEEARRHMKAGAAFYNDPAGHKCEEALREFTKAYELSGSLNALKGMAICNLELERDGAAIEGYSAYLAGKGASLDAAEKAQIEADLNALKEAVATVKLSANRPGIRVTDVRTPAKGFPIRNAYALPEAGEKAIGIHPGQHVITASLEGFPDQVWQVDIANGGAFAHAFTFEKAPVTMTRPVPTSVWATTGLTSALALTWGALAIRARLLNDDYARENGTRPATELETMRARVKAANVVADVFLGATLASLGTTLVLYATRPSVPAGSSVPGPAGKMGDLRLSPTAGIHGAGAILEGSF
ncbi:Hypothetical protein A7982_09532 [Minicystis rosea]|nr:Hypothetical protein A7982_09532 [Minicystis rosea]